MVQICDKVITFTRQLRIQVGAVGLTEQFFDARQRIGGTLVQLSRQLQSFAQSLTRFAQAIDHTQTVQTLGADALAQQQEL